MFSTSVAFDASTKAREFSLSLKNYFVSFMKKIRKKVDWLVMFTPTDIHITL